MNTLSLPLLCALLLCPPLLRAAPVLVERGPHHRLWQTVTQFTTRDGAVVEEVHSYVELQTGLHYLANGEWQESKEEIEIFPGGAAARKGPHQVIFAPNLNTLGAIDLFTADQKRLRSHILGLSYYDPASGRSALLAEVKDSNGELLPPNQVIYRDAFTDVMADVRYTYTKAGFEQDVILRSNLPSPAEYGLDPATTRLEILTEFLQPPPPAQRTSAQDAGADTLDFGTMQIQSGRAFPQTGPDNAVRVRKSWQKLEGRDFLIEAVEFPAIRPHLNQLPPTASLSTPGRNIAGGAAGRKVASAIRRLPVRRQARISTTPMPVARLESPPREGYVVDYSLLNSASNQTFYADTTYYVSGPVNLTGTTTIEGGTVVKYTNANSAKITIAGPLSCLTASYRPAVFTAKDDDTVGETISGSTGAPAGYYADPALYVDNSGSTLSGVRIAYARQGVGYNTTNDHTLAHAQLLHCQKGVAPAAGTFYLRNVLMYDILTNFYGGSYTGRCEHLTVNVAGNLSYDSGAGSQLFLTNSLLVAVTNLGSATRTTNQTYVLSDGSTVFQTVGAAAHYLADNSAYRDLGTTNLNPTLAAALKLKTTYPPLVYNSVYVTNYLTLLPQAQRDTDTPDLGYHYDPLDYVFGFSVLTNQCVLTVATGTAIGTFSPGTSTYGLLLTDGTTFTSEGSPISVNRIVRYSTVQEQANTNWTGTTFGPSLLTPGWAASPVPQLSFRFTDWSILAQEARHFYGYNYLAGFTVGFTDCQFHGGALYSEGATVTVTNCLFERVATTLTGGSAMAPVFYNDLFFGGSVKFQQGTNATGKVSDTLFDTVSLTQGNTVTNANIGYYNTPALTNSAGGNVTLTNLAYQAGPLGGYYYATNSSLINAGSRPADAAGLYHYTTLVSQAKETNSVVDIGFHYVALDSSNLPVDTNGDGLPDYLSDRNGNGVVDSGEIGWNLSNDFGLKVLITRPRKGFNLP